MLNFMDLARSGDQVIGVHLEMKRLGICPFSVEKLLFHCFEKADQTGGRGDISSTEESARFQLFQVWHNLGEG